MAAGDDATSRQVKAFKLDNSEKSKPSRRSISENEPKNTFIRKRDYL